VVPGSGGRSGSAPALESGLPRASRWSLAWAQLTVNSWPAASDSIARPLSAGCTRITPPRRPRPRLLRGSYGAGALAEDPLRCWEGDALLGLRIDHSRLGLAAERNRRASRVSGRSKRPAFDLLACVRRAGVPCTNTVGNTIWSWWRRACAIRRARSSRRGVVRRGWRNHDPRVGGHSQISLTLNTCSHVIPALGRAAAEQMDAVLAAGPDGSATG
jgi:hypothetical protein